MATGNRANDPFPGFLFEIRIDGVPAGGFSECSGLQLETEFQDYPEGGQNSFVHKLPTRTKQSNITLKRGVVDRSMWAWYWDLTQGKITRHNLSIVVYQPDRERKAIWNLNRALPCKWVGPDLNATQNNVAVETVELCYEQMGEQKFE
jgi:phage tail-like protein